MPSNPTCPHCEYEYDTEDTWHRGLDTNDGDSNNAECPNCGKPFVIRVSTVTLFESLTMEDAEFM